MKIFIKVNDIEVSLNDNVESKQYGTSFDHYTDTCIKLLETTFKEIKEVLVLNAT